MRNEKTTMTKQTSQNITYINTYTHICTVCVYKEEDLNE